MRAAPLARHGPVEEGQVGAGAARAIIEEQVIGGRVVLVHGFLDPPQPQRFGIEPVVGRSVGGDRRQVVNTGELHVWPPVVAFRYRPRTPTPPAAPDRSEEHTSELQSLMRISYSVFCLKKKNKTQ